MLKISKDYCSSTAWVNPWPSSCLNSDPTRLSPSISKGIFGFSKNLVIERMGLEFQKTSSSESIQRCRFTGFLCISKCFSVRIEAVDKIYSSITVYSKSEQTPDNNENKIMGLYHGALGRYTGDPRLMRISLVRISLLGFFKTFQAYLANAIFD